MGRAMSEKTHLDEIEELLKRYRRIVGDVMPLIEEVERQRDEAVTLLRDLYDHPNGINQDRVREFLAALADPPGSRDREEPHNAGIRQQEERT